MKEMLTVCTLSKFVSRLACCFGPRYSSSRWSWLNCGRGPFKPRQARPI